MAKMKDLSGKRFGRWSVIGVSGKIGSGYAWVCKCDCGTVRVVRGSNLGHGGSLSCGCLVVDIATKRLKMHGAASKETIAEYRIWTKMVNRCCDPSDRSFSEYGGRGISVCDRWRGDCQAFIDDVGKRPSPMHSIDRINNVGNYEPGNVRWATRAEQANNKRTTLFIEFNGERLSAYEWSRRTGIRQKTLTGRIKRGWSPERALTDVPGK